MACVRPWLPLSHSMLNITLCPLVYVSPFSQGFPRHWDILQSGSTQSCQSAWWHHSGQDSARDGVAKAGLVGSVVFRRLSTGVYALGWALTQCFGDTPAGSSQRAVSDHISSVLSLVTGPGLVFTQMIWKVQCCWV